MDSMFFAYLAAMALVTYGIRMIPFTLMRSKIKSPFVKSFLFYVPYSVLGAMTFPYIFYSTGDAVTSAIGAAVAFILAYFRCSLIVVAVCACAAAFAAGFVL